MKFKLMTIFICTLLFVGCTSEKTKIPLADQKIYQSDYKLRAPDYILFNDLKADLEEYGLEMWQEDKQTDTVDMDDHTYRFIGKGTWANVYIEEEKRENPGEIVGRIELGIHEDLESFTGLIDNKEVNSWLENLENQYVELGKSGRGTDEDYFIIRDAMAIGGTIISFLAYPGDYKTLDIDLGNIDSIPQEFEGIVAELEHEDLFVTGYTRGLLGNQITLANTQHYLNEEINYYREMENEIDFNNSMAYKIMYDPNEKDHYSAQIYGIIPEDSKDFTPIEDVVGIDTISRVMDMSLDDFEAITNKLNQELEKVKKLRKDGFFPRYNIEGEVAGYRYDLLTEMYGEFNRFTVLIEKI